MPRFHYRQPLGSPIAIHKHYSPRRLGVFSILTMHKAISKASHRPSSLVAFLARVYDEQVHFFPTIFSWQVLISRVYSWRSFPWLKTPHRRPSFPWQVFPWQVLFARVYDINWQVFPWQGALFKSWHDQTWSSVRGLMLYIYIYGKYGWRTRLARCLSSLSSKLSPVGRGQ